MAKILKEDNQEIYGGNPVVYQDAVENMKNNRKLLKDRIKPIEKAAAEIEKDTATEKVRLQGTKETKAPKLKPYTEAVDVKDRAELAKLVEKAKADKKPFKIGRSLKEGFRYTFMLEGIEDKLGETLPAGDYKQFTVDKITQDLIDEILSLKKHSAVDIKLPGKDVIRIHTHLADVIRIKDYSYKPKDEYDYKMITISRDDFKKNWSKYLSKAMTEDIEDELIDLETGEPASEPAVNVEIAEPELPAELEEPIVPEEPEEAIAIDPFEVLRTHVKITVNDDNTISLQTNEEVDTAEDEVALPSIMIGGFSDDEIEALRSALGDSDEGPTEVIEPLEPVEAEEPAEEPEEGKEDEEEDENEEDLKEELIEPKKGEKEAEFVSRFMADKVANKEFPDQKQRSAVAYSKFRDKKEKVSEGLEDDTAIIEDLHTFEPWAGGKDTWDIITKANKVDNLGFLLEDAYPHGIDKKALNELLWYEKDWVFDMLGISPDGVEPEETKEEKPEVRSEQEEDDEPEPVDVSDDDEAVFKKGVKK